ncbi:acetoin reductase family protein [Schizopora paradoxa]|uniref:Acetoin reductase family protein n=1 Tax=Schizopora paradoxa TaxID=27342 RepID=A0A0H2S621_9AGAM|nr:acetoin reductase family protein [Schizopora paradoxa]
MSSTTELTGAHKSAVVTGAAQGIGRSIAIRLAQDGYNLALNDLPVNKPQLEELAAEITNTHPLKGSSQGPFAHIIVGDVSDSATVQKIVNETASTFGSLDVMVANAGFMRLGPVQDINEDDYEKVMAINARGTMLCFKYAGQQMIKQGKGGSLIAASSTSGRQGHALTASYTMSKFAIRGLVHVTALDLGRFGIRCNAYAPGPVETQLTRDAALVLFKDLPPGEPPKFDRALPGEASTMDVANLVAFLASPQSSFITGQTYGICGGFYLN